MKCNNRFCFRQGTYAFYSLEGETLQETMMCEKHANTPILQRVTIDMVGEAVIQCRDTMLSFGLDDTIAMLCNLGYEEQVKVTSRSEICSLEATYITTLAMRAHYARR